VRTPIIAANLLLLPLFLALTGCGKPSLDVVPSPTTIGQATPIVVHVHDTHGVSKLTATLAQNSAQYQDKTIEGYEGKAMFGICLCHRVISND
jgi:hypothetical protein